MVNVKEGHLVLFLTQDKEHLEQILKMRNTARNIYN